MWLRRWLILSVALLIAFVVFLIRQLAAPTYEATATVRVGVLDGSASSQPEVVSLYADTVVGLAGTDTVLTEAVRRAGLQISVRTAADRVVAAASGSAGFVEITARGPSPSAAADLANGTADAVAARLIDDETEQLEAATADLLDQIQATLTQLNQTAPGPVFTALQERYAAQLSALTDIELTDAQQNPGVRLTLDSPAAPPTGQLSPVPGRDALLAFLVAVILTAEFVVAQRSFRRRLSEGDPAREVAGLLDVTAIEVDPDQEPEAVLAPLYRERLAAVTTVLVLDLTGCPGHDRAAALARAATLVGDPTELVEVDNAIPTATAAADRLADLGRSAHRTRPHGPSHVGGADKGLVLSVRGARLDARLLGAAREHPQAVVLVVDTATASRPQLQRDTAALRSVDASLCAVLITRPRTWTWRDAYRWAASRRLPA